MSTETNAPAAESAPAEGKDIAVDEPTIIADDDTTEPDGKATEPDKGGQEPAKADDDEQDEDEGKPRKKSRTKRLQERVQALSAEVERLKTQPPGKTAEPPPKEADFNGDYAAYDRAVRSHELKQAIREANAEQDSQKHQDVQGELARERAQLYRERAAEVRELIPDLEDVLAKANSPIRDEIAELIQESEKGPQLAYHLAKNPAQLRELNRMSPLSAAREIGRLEASLSLPTPKTTTKAPPPLTPPRGAASVVKAMTEMSMDEYVATRKKQLTK